jgi:lon-related putative ATP-dependent protease
VRNQPHRHTAARKRGVRKPAVETVLSRLRVPPEKLCWRCALGNLEFHTTDDIGVSAQVVGQRRAVDALTMGLEIEAVGYNVFVSGRVGTGRTTTVRRLLDSTRARPKALDDKCYVNNFRDPDQPRLLRLPAGRGRLFRDDMDAFVEFLAKNTPLLFEGETYQNNRQEIIDSFKERGGARVREFEKKIAAEGFSLVQTAPFMRPELAPTIEKQPAKIDALPQLVEEGRLTKERADEIRAKYAELSAELAVIFKEIRDYEKAVRDALIELDRGVVRPGLDERLSDLAEKYDKTNHKSEIRNPKPEASPKPETQNPRSKVDSPESQIQSRKSKLENPNPPSPVATFLNEVREAVLSRIDLFRQKPPEKGPAETGLDLYYEFRVNVLVDNSGAKTAPVVFETNPNYKNLFGSVERVWGVNGQWRTDFTRIKAGSLLKADRGVLVLNALDALTEPGVWAALKRCLRNRQFEVSGGDPMASIFGASGLKPEPVDIDLKVIMIGDPEVYGILAAYDEDFKKIFKVRADFDWVMPMGQEGVRQYVQVVKALCDKEKLRPFDRDGVRGVVEYGVRLAGRQDKLSTRFNVISELLTEAHHWAVRAGAKTVTYAHVQEALNRRRDRVRLIEEKLQESINQGTIYIDVTGSKVGQVNGLAVYETGEYAFGKPARITAKTGVGAAGIINIEREAQLSGPTHDKGVYILSGYLRHKFAQRRPLVFSASICFEQSYGGVDGDSASSTEVYALLSDLSGLAIRQDLAVTGSVNQQGEVQPIGGVNWKVEGFFETCRARGLTGTQGVIVPKTNLPELMLRPEVVEAVEQGQFHIYAVSTIDEGIELLTGVPAGVPDKRGNYPAASVNGRVAKRLTELYRCSKPEKPDAEKKESGGARKRKKTK